MNFPVRTTAQGEKKKHGERRSARRRRGKKIGSKRDPSSRKALLWMTAKNGLGEKRKAGGGAGSTSIYLKRRVAPPVLDGFFDSFPRRRGSFGATLANGIRSRSSLRFGMTCFFLVGKSIELAVTKLGRGAVALGGVG